MNIYRVELYKHRVGTRGNNDEDVKTVLVDRFFTDKNWFEPNELGNIIFAALTKAKDNPEMTPYQKLDDVRHYQAFIVATISDSNQPRTPDGRRHLLHSLANLGGWELWIDIHREMEFDDMLSYEAYIKTKD